MCGIAGIVGPSADGRATARMVGTLRHRGPDAEGVHTSPSGTCALGHTRLSIIDLSAAGQQPMADRHGTRHIVFNGEIYNHEELRRELAEYPFRSRTDTEVILAAYERWGDACVHRFIGMFGFAIWDERLRRLFVARDRFGVKPLYYAHVTPDTLAIASEIGALHAAGVPREPDLATWATYLTSGLSDHGVETFWEGIRALPAGHTLTWADGRLQVRCWYDISSVVGDDVDTRPVTEVLEEYRALAVDAVRLRFRADVPVGLAVSGGLDSSILLGAVRLAHRDTARVQTFSYVTGDPRYDETPWISRLLARTSHSAVWCRLRAEEVPALAQSVQALTGEPTGGVPNLAYARLFEEARERHVPVVLDGQGMDEQWAGYDYYAPSRRGAQAPLVQGTRTLATRADAVLPDARSLVRPWTPPARFGDPLRRLQHRDIAYTKLPRALRFNDRVSMRRSIELREPFLDHRLVELAMRQPASRKIRGNTHKWLLRRLARDWLPIEVVEAPKRPVSTPQREWLRGPLRGWATACIDAALDEYGGRLLAPARVRVAWDEFCEGEADNSFFVWQWISLGLLAESLGAPCRPSTLAQRVTAPAS